MKIYGEYVEYDTFKQPNGSTTEPSWSQFFDDAKKFEAGHEKTLYYQNTIQAHSSVPAVNLPPDQELPAFRSEHPRPVPRRSVAAGLQQGPRGRYGARVEHPVDHGRPHRRPATPDAQQADNDLAVGRIIDYISHSNVWSSSAIFIEEDDAQNGVDHVDGHRSPGYIVSPYAVQHGPTDHTYYTQVNMTRTIEQILGLTPMNQFDLVASPMRTAFVKGMPPADNFKPWTHVPNQVPLDEGVTRAGPNATPSVRP